MWMTRQRQMDKIIHRTSFYLLLQNYIWDAGDGSCSNFAYRVSGYGIHYILILYGLIKSASKPRCMIRPMFTKVGK